MGDTNSSWSGLNDTISIPAPSEIVFDVLTDPDRVNRWLPGGITADFVAPDRVRITRGSAVGEFRHESIPSELRLLWSAADGSGIGASAQVRESGGGGSTVDVTVRFRDGSAEPDDVAHLLADGAVSLRREVEENFTAG